MNPLFTVMLKVLPNLLPKLIPLADSLVGARGAAVQADTRLYEMEAALHALTARSQELERRMKQMRVMSLVSVLLSLGVLVTVLVR